MIWSIGIISKNQGKSSAYISLFTLLISLCLEGNNAQGAGVIDFYSAMASPRLPGGGGGFTPPPPPREGGYIA